MILVIGATGKVGSALVPELCARGEKLRCLVRSAPEVSMPPNVQIAIGSASCQQTLARALDGVDGVFLAMANGPTQREIELGVVQAAARARVQHIVKVSAPVVGPNVPVAIARMHYEIEQAIEASGMAFTHLRPYAFMQNLLAHAHTIVRFHLLFGMTGDARLNFVDARDIASVAASALLSSGVQKNVYALTGPEALSMPEVAERLSTVLGYRVRYVHQSAEQLRAGYGRAGLPDWLIEHLLEIQGLTLSEPEAPNGVVQEVTGRVPRSLDAFLNEQKLQLSGPRSWTDSALGMLLGRGV